MAVFDISFFSDALGRIAYMTAIIPLERPHHYGGSGVPASEPFRAVYLLHGYSGAHTDWIRGSRIEQLAMAHNIAVFMPSGENGFYLDDPIRGAYYSKLLCEDMISFTRAAFPLSIRREDTTIGGFSMGGYGALRNGLYRSDVFGSIIAFSSAIMTDELSRMKPDMQSPIAPYSYYVHTFGPPDQFAGSDKDPKALAKAILTEGKPVPNMYIACGTEDIASAQNRDYIRYLTEIGMPHVFKEGHGEHNWAYWDDHIEKALSWLDGFKAKV
jgi:S-formylglutathione hydrolase FrmB